MTILSHVCVDFYDKQRNLLFSVTPSLINCVLTAPEEIQEDSIFDLLLADHSLEAVRSVTQKKQLENDPTDGVTAEGKKTKTTRKDAGKAGAAAAPDAAAGASDPAAEASASADAEAASGADASGKTKSTTAGKAG